MIFLMNDNAMKDTITRASAWRTCDCGSVCQLHLFLSRFFALFLVGLGFSRGHGQTHGTESTSFLPYELLEAQTMEFFIFKREVKRSVRCRFVARIVERTEKGVSQGIADRDALARMNFKHLTHNV